MRSSSSWLLLLCWAGAAAAIKVNWTPNGEAPLPFSQKAREAMGAAGQAAATAAPPVSNSAASASSTWAR